MRQVPLISGVLFLSCATFPASTRCALELCNNYIICSSHTPLACVFVATADMDSTLRRKISMIFRRFTRGKAGGVPRSRRYCSLFSQGRTCLSYRPFEDTRRGECMLAKHKVQSVKYMESILSGSDILCLAFHSKLWFGE